MWENYSWKINFILQLTPHVRPRPTLLYLSSQRHCYCNGSRWPGLSLVRSPSQRPPGQGACPQGSGRTRPWPTPQVSSSAQVARRWNWQVGLILSQTGDRAMTVQITGIIKVDVLEKHSSRISPGDWSVKGCCRWWTASLSFPGEKSSQDNACGASLVFLPKTIAYRVNSLDVDHP